MFLMPANGSYDALDFPVIIPSEVGILSETQKQMCVYFFKHPGDNKDRIARALDIPRREVYEFFDSPTWDYVRSKHFTEAINDLLPKALKALEDCLSAKSPLKIRLDAAVQVLKNDKVLGEGKVNIVEREKKMVIVWGNVSGTKINVVDKDNPIDISGNIQRLHPTQ